MSEYIIPNIRKFDSIKDFNDAENHYIFYDTPFNELFNLDRAFIIGEPGYGKTRMMKEIVKLSENYGKSSIFVDLKKVQGSLDEYIFKKSPIAIPTDEIKSEDKLVSNNLIKSSDFKLGSLDNCFICLDALDEVRSDSITVMIENIKEFMTLYPNTFIFISCRLNHFKKYQELFTDLDFAYVLIKSFSIEQTKQYLNRFNFHGENLDKLTKILRFDSRQLIIQVPRYLQMIGVLAKDKGIDYISQLNIADIFEYFIYNKLNEESKKIEKRHIEILKRILEKIALVMEIYQTNTLTKDELITFFDDIDSNLGLSFLNQVPLDILYDRSLLKDNIDSIEFENTEFQEYLAAKEILRMGRVDQIVFDLAIDKNLREIYPSWFNTLKFLIDLDMTLLKSILDFGTSKSAVVRDEGYHKLLTSVQAERLSTELRIDIFEDVFNYYQSVLHWIDYSIAESLSYYIDSSIINILSKDIDNPLCKALYIRRVNSVSIITHLLERGILEIEQITYWKLKLVEFANDSNPSLRRLSINALRNFNDLSLLKQIKTKSLSTTKIDYDELISACVDINPNDEYTIKVILEGLKNRTNTVIKCISKINSGIGIENLFKLLMSDEVALYEFLDECKKGEKYYLCLLENIRKVLDSELLEVLHSFIISAFKGRSPWRAEDSDIIKQISMLLKEKNERYIFDLISKIKGVLELHDKIMDFVNIFSAIIEKEDVEEFIDEMSSFKSGVRAALFTLQAVKFTKRKNSEIIYEEGRKFFSKEYSEAEINWGKQSRKKHEPTMALKDFRFKLEPSKGKYMPDVFSFYKSHKEELQKEISYEDKERLIALVKGSVFEVFDPRVQRLVIQEKNKNSMTYTVDTFMNVFGDCIKIAYDLNIDISKYREKIVAYIPFGYSEDLEAIFPLIPNPSNDEIKILLNVYNEKRDDDLAKFSPSNFIEACKAYNFTSKAAKILEGFIQQEEFIIHDRVTSLELLASLEGRSKYLEEIFVTYSQNKQSESYKLAECANENLISRYLDNDAILWRLDQVKHRAFSFSEPNTEGAHWVSPQEQELNEKKFAFPIMNLKNPDYKKLYLDILSYSFLKLQENGDYYHYSRYLWQIVIAYFDGLKELKTYSHLNDLEKYVDKYCSAYKEINFFEYKINELRQAYSIYLGKPNNISSCIKKYNSLKAFKYLDIVTPEDLKNILVSIIKNELRDWIEYEGAYKFIGQNKGNQETLIQKTIKTQLENCMLRRGFRENEVTFIREPQLLDEKRIDILVFYGFVGPILIELKRVDNKEITNDKERELYKHKFLNSYIRGTKSHYGIFLLFNDNDKYTLSEYLHKLEDTYNNCPKVIILGVDCISY